MKKSIVLSLLLVTPTLFANENNQRVAQTFEKLHQTASVNCEYKYFLDVPRVKTIKQNFVSGKFAHAKYQIGEALVDIKVDTRGERGGFSMNFAGVDFEGGLSKYNYFEYDQENFSEEQRTIFEQYKMKSLDCSIEMAMEDNFVVNQKQLHVAMHPQYKYDVNRRSNETVQQYISMNGYQQVVYVDDYVRKIQSYNYKLFVENGSGKLNTLELGDIEAQIPLSTPIMVSPAGHNRYTLTKSNHEITYTGGNHNYCILNNTRRMLHAFFDKEDSETIIFRYILAGTVVQKGSRWNPIVRDMNIPRGVFKKSNLLKDVFKNMSDKQRNKYLDGMLNYFQNSYLNEKKYMFSKVTIIQKSESDLIPNKTIEIAGKGEKEYTIVFSYE